MHLSVVFHSSSFVLFTAGFPVTPAHPVVTIVNQDDTLFYWRHVSTTMLVVNQ